MNKKTFFILILISCLALFLNLYRKELTPPSFNADEAAFGYNAYSIAQTGKDEYGTTLPVRLKSFGDYKMPLYSYIAAPFVKFGGLTENTARMPNTVLVFIFPFIMFALVKKLFDRDEVGILAALLVSTSWGIQSMTRQAHEAFLAVFVTTLGLLFFVKLTKKFTWRHSLYFLGSLLLALFSYQTSRIFAVYFFILSCIYFLRHRKGKLFLASVTAVLILFAITDVIYKPARVSNLFFTNTPGFSMRINEFRGEGGSRLMYNKLMIGTREFIYSYSKYFSPQFLIIGGDENPRFGNNNLAPITAMEYLFLFIGLYFIFKNKEKYRYLILSLLLIAPVPGALSWAGVSLTRTLFFLIPILIICAYGVVQIQKLAPKKYSFYVATLFIALEIFFLVYTWDFYFNHYAKRALTIRAWQSGYRELSSYVKDNYDTYDHFYITKKNGEPYIFLLYYLKYPPEKYQTQASLTGPDEYGFGQVEKFDKFTFSTNPISKDHKSYVIVGYPDDFNGMKIDKSKLKKIQIGTEEIFWIYEQHAT